VYILDLGGVGEGLPIAMRTFFSRRVVASETQRSRVLSVSWLIRSYPIGERYSRKKVDLPAAGEPTNRTISGLSGGFIDGRIGGVFADTVSVELRLVSVDGWIVGVGM